MDDAPGMKPERFRPTRVDGLEHGGMVFGPVIVVPPGVARRRLCDVGATPVLLEQSGVPFGAVRLARHSGDHRELRVGDARPGPLLDVSALPPLLVRVQAQPSCCSSGTSTGSANVR